MVSRSPVRVEAVVGETNGGDKERSCERPRWGARRRGLGAGAPGFFRFRAHGAGERAQSRLSGRPDAHAMRAQRRPCAHYVHSDNALRVGRFRALASPFVRRPRDIRVVIVPDHGNAAPYDGSHH
jgi:hypothetical protein